MEDKIEVGEFVRTNKGNIGQVIDIFQGHCVAKYHIEFKGNVKVKRQYLSTKTIVKHSKQLIDLIECGDYVNGELITDKWVTRISSIRSNFSEEDIKTILTKESYMANCYKVGGEEC